MDDHVAIATLMVCLLTINDGSDVASRSANSTELDLQECFTRDGQLVDSKIRDAIVGLLHKMKLSLTKKLQ